MCFYTYPSLYLNLHTYIKLLFDSYLQASIKCKHSWRFVQSHVLRKQRRRSSYDTAKDAALPSLELRDGGRGRNLSDTGSASETNRLFLFHSCAHGTQEQPLSLSFSLSLVSWKSCLVAGCYLALFTELSSGIFSSELLLPESVSWYSKSLNRSATHCAVRRASGSWSQHSTSVSQTFWMP